MSVRTIQLYSRDGQQITSLARDPARGRACNPRPGPQLSAHHPSIQSHLARASVGTSCGSGSRQRRVAGLTSGLQIAGSRPMKKASRLFPASGSKGKGRGRFGSSVGCFCLNYAAFCPLFWSGIAVSPTHLYGGIIGASKTGIISVLRGIRRKHWQPSRDLSRI